MFKIKTFLLLQFLFFFSLAAFAQNDFKPKNDYPTGTNPISIFAADLDGDNDTDLVVANYGSNSISVLKNDSNGNFADTDYAVGTQPISVVAAYLDTNLSLDLVVANYGSNNFSILFNNGDGIFALDSNYSVAPFGKKPTSVFAANLDTDSYYDIAVVDSNATLLVFKNNGSGTFAPIDFQATGGTRPYSVFASKIDGDSDLDLIVANMGDSSIRVFKNNGDGTFAIDLPYSTGTSPRSIFVAELNGDGYNDVVTANNGSNTVSILRNLGDGTFATKVDSVTGSGPYSVYAKDLVGDATRDLMVANYNDSSVSILRNLGSGTFATKVNYRTGKNPASVVAADFDNDGDQDLAVANYGSDSISILMRNRPPFWDTIPNDTTVKKGENLTFRVHASDLDNDPLVLDTTFLANAKLVDSGNGSGSFSFTTGFAQPGEYKITFKASDGALIDSSIVRIVVDTGYFADAVNYPAGSSPSSVAAADFDGDGYPDLAVTNPSANKARFLKNNGRGEFDFVDDPGVGFDPVSIVAVHLDTSFGIDLAVVNRNYSYITVLRNNISGSFSYETHPYNAGTDPRAIFAADFDGDSDTDLAVANFGSNFVSIFKNNGNGGFDTTTYYSVGFGATSVFGADFDNDGYVDLTLTGTPFGSDSVTVIFNTGTGSFANPAHYLTGKDPKAVFAAKLDTDSYYDLVVANYNSNTISIFKNDGNGAFPSRVDYATGFVRSGPNSVFVTDLVGEDSLDSFPDIAVANGLNGTVSIFRNKGDGTFIEKLDYSTGSGKYSEPSWIEASDVDKDGDNDLAVANNKDGTVSILLNNAITCKYKPGDVNGDGTWKLTDIIALVNIVFKDAPFPDPLCRSDCNGTGGNPSLTDIICLVNKVFKGGANPQKIGKCCKD